MSTDERVSNLKEAAFASEMARRRAVGALRANRKSLGALIQVLLHLSVGRGVMIVLARLKPEQQNGTAPKKQLAKAAAR